MNWVRIVKRLCCCLAAWHGGCVFAGEFEGPRVSYEMTSGSNLSATGVSGWSGSHRGLQADLPIPIPTKFGIFIPTVDYYEESRAYTGSSGLDPQIQSSIGEASSLAVGLIYYHPEKEKTPAWLISAARFSEPDFRSSPGAMYEALVGTQFSDSAPRLDPAWKNRTLLAFRIRKYPTFTQYLPIFGKRYTLPSRLFFDLEFPSHALLGIDNSDDSTRFEGGLRLESKQFAFASSAANGWLVGSVYQFFFGWRQKVYGIFHLYVEAGVQTEKMDITTDGGVQLISSVKEFAPWGRVTLKTIIPTPE